MPTSCSRCGAGNPDAARWCGTCGAALDPVADAADAGDREDAAPRPERGRRRIVVAALAGIVAVVAVSLVTSRGDPPPDAADQPVDLDPGDAGRESTLAPPPALLACDETAPTTDPRPCLAWSVPDVASAIVDDGRSTVYVSGHDAIEARSFGNGALEWTAPVGGDLRLLAVGDGIVYAADGTDVLAAGADGLRWRVPVGAGVEPLPGTAHLVRGLRLVDDRLFATVGAELVALDAASGGELWRWSEQHVLSVGVADPGPYVVVVDGVLGLDPATGERRWRQPLVTFNNRSHVVADGVVLVADDSSQVSALDPDDGTVVWRLDTGGALALRLAPAPGSLIVGLADGSVLGADAETGAVRWRRDAGAARAGIVAVDDDLVVVGGAGPAGGAIATGLTRASGALRWQTSLARIPMDVGLTPELVVVLLGDRLQALDRDAGNIRWQVAVPDGSRVADLDRAVVTLVSPDAVVALRLSGAG